MVQPFSDDGLEIFAADGPPPLPPGGEMIERDETRLWFAGWGSGPAVLLLHGGMGNANNFGHQVPALLDAGYRVIVMDSRGHGRSSWNSGAFAYADMALDAFAVLDHLNIARAAVVGWSDGACTGLAMAKQQPQRVSGVFFLLAMSTAPAPCPS
ncbi:alpha/beta fold hydrolase [Devosia aurantiaca]|uniref:alpha/beta fold hydrolase n=1 Tax=Devosia aurantiaca TaxID=2714858 RepID=UPI002E27E67F|nr:alpha/beta fold hydrolase [Devosia aurantiaca]